MSEETVLEVIYYLYLLLVIVGTLANILAFIVFSRKKFKNTVFSTYFRILLIIDLIGLLYSTLGKFLNFEFGINLRNISAFLCRITMPIVYSIPPISAYITVMISFDRWLTIAKPAFFLLRKNKIFQVLICIAIIVINFIYNGQLFFSHFMGDPADNTSTPSCRIIDYTTLATMDLINSTLLPFFLMLLFTLLTVKALFDASKIIRQTSINPVRRNSNASSKKDNLRKRDIKFAIVSILLNIIFLVLNGPFTIYSFLYDYILTDSYYSWMAIVIMLFLTYCNHAIVFFINIFVNKQFRDELYIILTRKKVPKEKNSTNLDAVNEGYEED